MYRKPTKSDTTIHFTSNHPLQQKLAMCIFYINIVNYTITEQAKQQEWNTICTVAKNNGFPLQLIHNLKSKITRTQHTANTPTQKTKKNWITFTYHSPLICKVTNLFKTPIYILHSEQITQFSYTFATNPPTIH